MPITEVIPLFPSTLVVGDISDVDNDKIVNYLLDSFKDYKSEVVDNTFYKSDAYLHKEEVFKPLVEQIYKFVKLTMDDVFEYKDLSPQITLMWATGMGTGDTIHRHYHPNSLYSGVYYPQNRIDYSPLRFYTPKRPMLMPSVKRDNMYNSFCMNITPKQNMIVLFPSYLEHDTVPCEQNDLRLSVAFNIMFTGTYGEEETLTKLTLKELQ